MNGPHHVPPFFQNGYYPLSLQSEESEFDLTLCAARDGFGRVFLSCMVLDSINGCNVKDQASFDYCAYYVYLNGLSQDHTLRVRSVSSILSDRCLILTSSSISSP